MEEKVQLGGVMKRIVDNHVFDILESGERGRMEEKKMNRQGLRV